MSSGARRARRMFIRRAAVSLLQLTLIVLLGGFAAAALVRYSPGFDVDENSWNPKIGATTLASMHARRESENRLFVFYFHYLQRALHGDLGESDSLRMPVTDLLRERAPVTARLMTWGTAGGLMLGALFAWAAAWSRYTAVRIAAISINGLLLAIPPAVLALVFFFRQAPLAIAVALALSPRVFATMRAVLDEIFESPILLAARSRGLSPATVALRYAALMALPRFIALAGVSLVIAFGCLVPMEALCDVAGIGQLAWKAALARDLPLLSGLALSITFVTACAQSAGEFLA